MSILLDKNLSLKNLTVYPVVRYSICVHILASAVNGDCSSLFEILRCQFSATEKIVFENSCKRMVFISFRTRPKV